MDASVESDWSPSLQSVNSNGAGKSRGLAMADDGGICEVKATNNCVTASASGSNARAAAVCHGEESGSCFLV